MCDASDIDPTTESGMLNIASGGLVGGAAGVGDAIEGKLLGGDAADAAREAAATQAAFQHRGLDYLIETEEIPQALRQAGLQQLGGIYGLPGFEEYGNQAQMIEQAKMSPLYEAILGTGEAGQEAIARTASGTSGLRGGGTVSDLANYQQNLEQEALLESYNQQLSGIQGLAQMPSAASQISQQYGQIGQTQAMGQVASAQAQQQALGNLIGLGGTLGAAAISDVRLKTNIKYLLPTSHPEIHFYQWDWLPESGKTGNETGYLAQEVKEIYPNLVAEGDDGYYRINKTALEDKLKSLEAE